MKISKKIFTLLSLAIILVIILTFIRILFFTKVSGDSMEPGLSDGDLIFVLPAADISYGDIIVTSDNISYGRSIVKRVIALEGDSVFINFSTGEVFVNDRLLAESYIAEPTAVWGDVTFPLMVPEGTVFLLGDNRNHSVDSRYSSVGCVPVSQIDKKVFGQPIRTFFP